MVPVQFAKLDHAVFIQISQRVQGILTPTACGTERPPSFFFFFIIYFLGFFNSPSVD